MQQKKNIRLLISLIAIIAITILVFVFTHTKSATSVDKNLFHIENLDKVDHVILESKKAKTDLKFNGSKWMINGNYEADRQMIKVLFATLQQTIAKRQAAASLQDSLQKEIVDSGIKISCFEGGRLAKEIWAGGNLPKNESYFFSKGEKAYVVTIPGYRVYVASIFELTANDWRDKQVFNFNWQNIKSLEATFPSDPKQNFKASFKQKFFSIEGIATDTTRLDQFMDALLQLRSEKILDSMEVKNYSNDFLQQPIIEIVIQDVAARTYPLILFPPEKRGRYVVGKINDEVVLLNQMTLKEIVKRKDYFVQH